MCGITGSVGRPKNAILSHNLQTNLLRETKRRGRHATGFYAIDLEKKPVWHKAPISSDLYVRRPEWKQLITGNIALIGHARFTTNGAATVNGNNHPHLSKSGNMALVHNGIVYNYNELKGDYKGSLESDCDSELILRIITQQKDPLRGIKKAYELLGSGGDFACELVHLNPKTGKIMFYFFRDDGRPGKMIDARETLGQLVFCSEKDIWKDAVLKSGMPRTVRQLSVHNIPEYTILVIDADTLKVKEVKVEKPKYKTRYHSRSHASRVYNYDDDYYTYGGTGYVRGTGYGHGSSTAPTIHRSSSVTYNKSVLGDGWVETTNPDTGLPRFIFDPNETEEDEDDKVIDAEFAESKGIELTPEENQDQAFRALLKQCIDDENQRYPGWQDEALSYGLINEDQWVKFSQDESPDILDLLEEMHENGELNDESFDPVAAHQEADDAMLADMCSQQMVDGDDEYDI